MPFLAATKAALASASPKKLSWDDYKPIIRSAIAAWLGVLLMIVPASLKILGQAAFLVLVVVFANPPDGPVVKVAYNSVWNILFVGAAWIVYIISSRAATAARTTVIDQTRLELADFNGYSCGSTPQECFTAAIFDGRFVEGPSSLIYATFFFLGIAVLLFIKVRYPQRVFSGIFATVALIISHLYGPLFPYFYPNLGQVFFVPVALQSGINVMCSLLLWPETMSHAYTRQLIALVDKIRVLAEDQKRVMASNPESTDWVELGVLKEQVRAARTSLASFRVNDSLLERECSYGRHGASDLQALVQRCRDVILKLGGFSLFYDLVSTTMELWDDEVDEGVATPARSSADLNGNHRHPSLDQAGTFEAPSSRSSFEKQARPSDAKRNKSRPHLLPLHHRLRQTGIFEMRQYQEHEQQYPRRWEIELTVSMLKLAAEASAPLYDAVSVALAAVTDSLRRSNKDRIYNKLFSCRKLAFEGQDLKRASARLQQVLATYKATERLRMLEPYVRLASDTAIQDSSRDIPSRPIRRFFYLEFHLIRMAESTFKLIQAVSELGHERPARWHYPSRLFTVRLREQHRHDHVDLPVQEFEANFEDDEDFQTEARDPDAEPPSNILHLIGKALVGLVHILKRQDVAFAVKSALLVTLLALPAFLRKSAGFFYRQRGLWACIMAALSVNPLTGDAIFIFIFRLIGTISGALFGLVLWYISCGSSSDGNYYGLGATMAVASIAMAYIRLRFVYINPQPAIFFLITTALVTGYSWLDAKMPATRQSSLGVGWPVAWRRATLVAIGCAAAFVWSFIPRPTTGRQVVRKRLSKGLLEIGNVFTEVSNYSRGHKSRGREEHIRRIVTRANEKLLILNQRLLFSSFEPPISGRWPKEKYVRILQLQRQLLDLLVAFVGCLTQMHESGESGQQWMNAMFSRTGWHDPYFSGDVLATLCLMSHAIQTGTALPQLVPSPLINRFYDKKEIPLDDVLEGSLPRRLDVATLRNPDYASFAVASTITFAIVKRIDDLMQVAKELVGESFHSTGWPLLRPNSIV